MHRALLTAALSSGPTQYTILAQQSTQLFIFAVIGESSEGFCPDFCSIFNLLFDWISEQNPAHPLPPTCMMS